MGRAATGPRDGRSGWSRISAAKASDAPAPLDYPLHASGIRQHQVRELANFVSGAASPSHPAIICGDFNASPDSDELRMLTGRSQPPVPGMVFYDAWEVADDGGPGFTWSNQNPLAAVSLLPDRRFDYVLSAWPRRGGAGHPTRCELLGVRRPSTNASFSASITCSRSA